MRFASRGVRNRGKLLLVCSGCGPQKLQFASRGVRNRGINFAWLRTSLEANLGLLKVCSKPVFQEWRFASRGVRNRGLNLASVAHTSRSKPPFLGLGLGLKAQGQGSGLRAQCGICRTICKLRFWGLGVVLSRLRSSWGRFGVVLGSSWGRLEAVLV